MPKKTKSKITIEEFIQAVEGMDAMELAKAVKALERRFGIEAEEKPLPPKKLSLKIEKQLGAKKYTIVLARVGRSKSKVLMAVRHITGFDLPKAKRLIDKAPTSIRKRLTWSEVEQIKDILERAGATVEIHG